MTREQLEHVLRAAAAISNELSFVVVGSQAVLLPFPNAPAKLLRSREVDLCPAMHPERADLIDKAVAGREKDADFVRVLLRERMIDIETLRGRVRCLDIAKHPVAGVLAWVDRRAQEANA